MPRSMLTTSPCLRETLNTHKSSMTRTAATGFCAIVISRASTYLTLFGLQTGSRCPLLMSRYFWLPLVHGVALCPTRRRNHVWLLLPGHAVRPSHWNVFPRGRPVEVRPGSTRSVVVGLRRVPNHDHASPFERGRRGCQVAHDLSGRTS